MSERQFKRQVARSDEYEYEYEIEFEFGDIESAVKELKSHKELVCGSFNEQMLYSDIDTVDTARHTDIIHSWLADHKPLILCGPPGSG